MFLITRFLISRRPYLFSGNNRRFNNYNQRDNYQRDFRGGSDFNQQSNYNNNRYQNGDSERGGGNWNNRGGSRTFSRSSGAPDARFAQQPPPPVQPENGGGETQPPREPVNTRWQEPPQQEYNNRGGGYGGKWNHHGSNAPVDYTVPLPRDERIELELFGKLEKAPTQSI